MEGIEPSSSAWTTVRKATSQLVESLCCFSLRLRSGGRDEARANIQSRNPLAGAACVLRLVNAQGVKGACADEGRPPREPRKPGLPAGQSGLAGAAVGPMAGSSGHAFEGREGEVGAEHEAADGLE